LINNIKADNVLVNIDDFRIRYIDLGHATYVWKALHWNASKQRRLPGSGT